MGSSRGRNLEDTAQKKADVAFNEYQASPLETQRVERTSKFLKQFDSGTDVKDMEAVSPYLQLWKNAKNRQTNQMVGRGAVALGQNPNVEAQLTDQDKYLQAQREQEASGMLYDSTNQAYSDAVNESQNLIGYDQSRKAGRAGLAENRYQTVINRPTRIPLWERLLGMGVAAGTTIATGGMSGAAGGGRSVG